MTFRPTGGQPGDKFLGMNDKISRRDFLNASLLASASSLLTSLTPVQFLAQQENWDGYGGVGDYRDAHGNTWEVMNAAHGIRDAAFDQFPPDAIGTGEVFDCVIVGGGISGLSAALFFSDQAGGGRTCLVLENHPMFGGEAKCNEFIVDGEHLMAPQGSNMFWVPNPGPLTDQVYERIRLDGRKFEFQGWKGPSPEVSLSPSSYAHLWRMPRDFGFYFGAKFGQKPGMWVTDPWGKNLEGTRFSAQIRADLLKWRKEGNKNGNKSSDEKELRNLDTITTEDYMVEVLGVGREMIRLVIAPIVAAGYGLGPDALSGYLGSTHWYFDAAEGLTFPGGNAGIARHIAKAVIPDAIPGPPTLHNICRNRVDFSTLDRPGNAVRIRLRSTAVRVEHERQPEKSDFVRVTYTSNGKAYYLKARGVIMAGGGWSTRRVVRDLPTTHREAYGQFNYSACLVANVAMRNWRFLYKLGLSGGRWFEGFGYWTEVRKTAKFGSDSPTIGPDSPTVLTLYVPLFYPGMPNPDQGHKGRAELLSIPFRDYERRIREQFVEMFSRSGFEARRDIAGIILNRWGHAFLNPGPGFFFGKDGKQAPQEVLRNKSFGRIAFAHTDLAPTMDHRTSIREAHRAVGQVLKTLS